MKKTLWQLIALAAVVLSACQESPTSYTVTGILADSLCHGRAINIIRQDDYKKVDSTVIDGNRFVFKGTATEPALCRISIKPGLSTCIILENGEIEIDFNKSPFPQGTDYNDELARINQREQELQTLFTKGMRQAMKKKQPIKEFKQEFDANIRTEGLKLFRKHHNDVIGYYLLNSSYMNLLSPEERQEVINSTGPWLGNTAFAKYLKERMNNP